MTTPSPSSKRQTLPTFAKVLAALLGVVASVATIEPWLAGLSWLGLIASTLLKLLPDLVGIGVLCVLIWWVIRVIRQKGFFAGPLTLMDWFFLAGLGVLGLFFVISLARLEYAHLRLLRYTSLGPGLVVERERAGEPGRAADAAAALGSFPFNRRFKTRLAMAEQRLRSKALIAADLGPNFDRLSAKSSPVRLLESSLWGLYLESGSPRYQERVESARAAWEAQKAAVKRQSAGSAFSVESSIALGLLRNDKRLAALLSPAPIEKFERLRTESGAQTAFEAAAAAEIVESWLTAAEGLRQKGKFEPYSATERTFYEERETP